MEIFTVPDLQPEYPKADHLVLEAWNIDSGILQNPERVADKMRDFLKQLGRDANPNTLQYDFGGNAASVVTVNHGDDGRIHGYTSTHGWEEHKGYLNMVIRDDQVNRAEAQQAFAESFQPGELEFDRPKQKLAHIVTRLLISNSRNDWGSGRFRLETQHDALVNALELNRAKRPKIWENSFGRGRAVSAILLLESHSIIEVAAHSVTIDLFTCTGRRRLEKAPELIQELFEGCIGKPDFRDVDYDKNLQNLVLDETTKKTSVLARVI